MATAELVLPLGEVALIDVADAEVVAGFSWRALRVGNTTYVHAWRNKLHLLLHRLVLGAPADLEVDHINGNGLDNRRVNLRFASHFQNLANRPGNRRGHKTSRFKGVSWNPSRHRWVAYVHYEGKTRSLGRFHDEETAARAYDVAATAIWGEFARLNLP